MACNLDVYLDPDWWADYASLRAEAQRHQHYQVTNSTIARVGITLMMWLHARDPELFHKLVGLDVALKWEHKRY